MVQTGMRWLFCQKSTFACVVEGTAGSDKELAMR